MNDTPRTDTLLIAWDFAPEPKRVVEHARDLERELNAFVRLVLGDEATLRPSGNVVLAVATLKSDMAELARLRAGGCARDQRTTQFCAEAVELERELEAWKAYAKRLEEAGDEMAKWFPFSSTRMKRVVGEWAAARGVKP